MKIHPLVWLGISDHLQRNGDSALGLYGSKTSFDAHLVFDIPLKEGQLNEIYLKKKVKQLNVVNEDCDMLGIVIEKGKLHDASTQKYVSQCVKILKSQFVVMELDKDDFDSSISHATDSNKLGSILYCFNIETQSLVPEKLELITSDAEKSAISSIIDNDAHVDDAHILNTLLRQKTTSLNNLSNKVDVLLSYLENVNKGSIKGDHVTVDAIGSVVRFLDGDSSATSVKQAFDEKEFIGLFSAVLSLMTDGLSNSNKLVDNVREFA